MSIYSLRVYGILINEQQQILVSDEYIRGGYFTKFPGGGLEETGAREIHMNGLEAEGRKHATARKKRLDTSPVSRNSTSNMTIGIAELVDSVENVGNHLFRLAKALAAETDY